MEAVKGAAARLRTGAIRNRYPRSIFASTVVHAVVLGVGCAFGVRYVTAAEEPVRVATRFVEAPAVEFREELEEPLETEIPDEEVFEPELVPVDYDLAPVTYDEAELAEPPEDDLRIDDLPMVSWAIEPAPAEPEPEPVVPPPAVDPEPVEVVLLAREPARRVYHPKPEYPRLSSRFGEEGSVLCLLHVSVSGAVTLVEIEESSGFERLDDAARETLATWRFRPAMLGDEPVASTYRHRVRFQLGT